MLFSNTLLCPVQTAEHCSDHTAVLFADRLWAGYNFPVFIHCSKSGWELPLWKGVSGSNMCSPSLASVQRSPTRQRERGEGGREGSSNTRRKWGMSALLGDAWGAQLIFCTAWNLFICYTLTLLLETAQTSKYCACSKWPQGAWARWNQGSSSTSDGRWFERLYYTSSGTYPQSFSAHLSQWIQQFAGVYHVLVQKLWLRQ